MNDVWVGYSDPWLEKVIKEDLARMSLLRHGTEAFPELLDKMSAFPHIVETIKLMWGTQRLDSYINDLLVVKRDETRQGFPAEIATILSVLRTNNQLRIKQLTS